MKLHWFTGVLAMLGFAFFISTCDGVLGPPNNPRNTGGIASGGIPSTGGTGGMGDEILPGSVTRGEDCVYQGRNRGTGGSDQVGCETLTVTFEPALPSLELSATVTTSLGDTFTVDEMNTPTAVPSSPTAYVRFKLHNPSSPFVYTPGPETIATALVIAGSAATGWSSPQPYSPEWVDVEVRQRGIVVGAKKLTPRYACEDVTWDDWCWKAEPIVLRTGAQGADAGL